MGPNPNGPLSKVLEILDTQVLGVRSVGPVGDFLDSGGKLAVKLQDSDSISWGESTLPGCWLVNYS